MKENRLIIAAAGSGKTTSLVKKALSQTERVLITTFTNENESEIRDKFVRLNGCVPCNVTLQTWFSFLLQHGVKPFQATYNMGMSNFHVSGVHLVNEQSGIKCHITKGKLKIPIPYSEEENFFKHYFDGNNKIFSDKIAKFVCRANESSNGKVIRRMSAIFPYIYIDEVQDLAGYDLEILKMLFQSASSIMCVGDPRQATFYTHWEKKYSNYKNGKIQLFVENECKKDKVTIDTTSLSYSHRNNKAICDFSSILYSDMPVSRPCNCKACHPESISHQGVFLIDKDNCDEYIQLYKPIQLRHNKKVGVSDVSPCCNFGNSKGKTFNRVLVYPTDTIKDWLKNRNLELKEITKAKLYVAITRARYSVAFVLSKEECSEISDIPIWQPIDKDKNEETIKIWQKIGIIYRDLTSTFDRENHKSGKDG